MEFLTWLAVYAAAQPLAAFLGFSSAYGWVSLLHEVRWKRQDYYDEITPGVGLLLLAILVQGVTAIIASKTLGWGYPVTAVFGILMKPAGSYAGLGLTRLWHKAVDAKDRLVTRYTDWRATEDAIRERAIHEEARRAESILAQFDEDAAVAKEFLQEGNHPESVALEAGFEDLRRLLGELLRRRDLLERYLAQAGKFDQVFKEVDALHPEVSLKEHAGGDIEESKQNREAAQARWTKIAGAIETLVLKVRELPGNALLAASKTNLNFIGELRDDVLELQDVLQDGPVDQEFDGVLTGEFEERIRATAFSDPPTPPSSKKVVV